MTPLSRRLTSACLSWQAAERDKAQERAHRWQTAAVAFRLENEVEQLAKLLGVGPEAVRQMSSGYKVFWMLGKMDLQEAKRLRRLHGYTRFYEVGVLWAKYNFDVELLFEYLAENVSVAAICATITNHYDPDPEWKRTAVSYASKMGKFEEWGGVTPRLRRLARLWKAETERL